MTQAEMLAEQDAGLIGPAPDSSFMGTGLTYLGGLADKWLQYQAIKRNVDFEHAQADTQAPGGNPAAHGGMPQWAILAGVCLVALVAWRALR